jgi:type IV pilus assembly protein PilA
VFPRYKIFPGLPGADPDGETQMFNKKGFTLVELMIVVAIIGILAAIAIPNFVDMQYRAKRAEVPSNVDGIKTAQIAYDAAFDKYIEVSSWMPSSNVAKTQRSWTSGTGFDTLGWGPDGKVRGRYKVTSKSTTDFLVTGECDVDNDDTQSTFTATKSINTKMNTGASIY